MTFPFKQGCRVALKENVGCGFDKPTESAFIAHVESAPRLQVGLGFDNSVNVFPRRSCRSDRLHDLKAVFKGLLLMRRVRHTFNCKRKLHTTHVVALGWGHHGRPPTLCVWVGGLTFLPTGVPSKLNPFSCSSCNVAG